MGTKFLGQGRGGAFMHTQSMKALLAARPREHRGESKPIPTPTQRDGVRVNRIAKENAAVAVKRR